MATGTDTLDRDDSLSESDLAEVVREILPAQTQSEILGHVLTVRNVSAIHAQYSDPQQRLVHVISEFLKQYNPLPTWKRIVAALRDPLVNLPRVAKRIEKKYNCSSPKKQDEPVTSERIPPPVSSTNSPHMQPSSSYRYNLKEVKKNIGKLEQKFAELKDIVMGLLNEQLIQVEDVVHKLTDLSASEQSEHEMFFEERLNELERCKEHKHLFSRLNRYWNYLSPQLLQHLAQKFHLSEVQEEMDSYEEDLSQFRSKTMLKLFSEADREHIWPDEKFSKIFLSFQKHISRDMTLQNVEDVRQRYGRAYNLRKFALMLSAKVKFKTQTFQQPPVAKEMASHLLRDEMVASPTSGRDTPQNSATMAEPPAPHKAFTTFHADAAVHRLSASSPSTEASKSKPSTALHSYTTERYTSAAPSPSKQTTSTPTSTLVALTVSPVSVTPITEVNSSSTTTLSVSLTPSASPTTTELSSATLTSSECNITAPIAVAPATPMTSEKGSVSFASDEHVSASAATALAPGTCDAVPPSSFTSTTSDAFFLSENPSKSAQTTPTTFSSGTTSLSEHTSLTSSSLSTACYTFPTSTPTTVLSSSQSSRLSTLETAASPSPANASVGCSLLVPPTISFPGTICSPLPVPRTFPSTSNSAVVQGAFSALLPLSAPVISLGNLSMPLPPTTNTSIASSTSTAAGSSQEPVQNVQTEQPQQGQVSGTDSAESALSEKSDSDTDALEEDIQLPPVSEVSAEDQVAGKKIQPDSPGGIDMMFPGPPLTSSTPTRHSGERAIDDYYYVKEPSSDYFCPVTFSLLLHPHLTSCCGSHLSQEAAMRIQQEGRACPICQTAGWSTVLNKNFLRQVKALHVFCRHKDRGCAWQGEIFAYEVRWEGALWRVQSNSLPLFNRTLSLMSKEEDATYTSSPTKPRRLTVQCRRKKKAPCVMMRGASTTHGQFAYFTPAGHNSVYRYDFITDEWDQLTPCPFENTGLVFINGQLTAVGGEIKSSRTNKLHTLREGKWVEEYPPMNTAHSQPAVVSTPDSCHVLVIGGDDATCQWTATVESLHVPTRTWHKLSNLPRPLSRPSATVCWGQVHVIGGSIGYSSSLQDLPSGIDLPPSSPTLPWTPLPWLPVTFSTAATLCDQLVTVCGWRNRSLVSSVYQLVEGKWVEIGTTSGGRSWCLVTNPSADRMIVVGVGKESNSIEECIAK